MSARNVRYDVAAADGGQGVAIGIELTPMVKIEVVVGGRDVPAIREAILDAGAWGFTSPSDVSNVSGFGQSGPHQGSVMLNDRDSLTMLITVVPPERSAATVAAIRPSSRIGWASCS